MYLKSKRMARSSLKMAAMSPEPEEEISITEVLSETDGGSAEQGQPSDQRPKMRFSLRRGVYKLAVKVIGHIL